MVAILVIATFVVFVLVDFYLQTHRPQVARAKPLVEPQGGLFPINVVAGFALPANLSYHPGHAWVGKEGHRILRIGLDDFASRLLGKMDGIELPARGRWLRQGEKGWIVARGNHKFEMVSPIEGEVVEINEEALKNPVLIHQDPYGAGWLVAVSAPGEEANLRNLLRGRLAQRWMEESVATLQSRMDSGSTSLTAPSLSRGTTQAHLQDGGRAVPDILAQLPEERWEKLVRELLLL